MTRCRSTLAAFAMALLASTGCTESSRAISPVSPSPTSPSPPSPGSPGARVTGTVIGGTTGTTVAVDGTPIADVVDGAGHFELTGVPAGDIQLRFESAGLGAALPIAGITDEDQIEIDVTLSGGSATLDRMRRRSPDHTIEVKGFVSGLSGSCPDLRVVVGGTTVTTNGATRFEDGTCASVQNGVRVEVKGTLQPDGSLLADKVDVDYPDPNSSVELKGLVAGRGGACPALTFTVNGTAVTTNSATRFEDGLCTDVVNGTRVEIKGTRQSGGIVLATKVDIDKPDQPDPGVKVKGIVAGRSGACPALTFSVNATTIVANAATQFEDGVCSDVQNGTDVDVKGIRQSNGTVLASRIDIDRPDPEVELKGFVSNLGAACPNRTFSINATPVVTNSATRFEDGTCAALQNGTRVEVKGTRQSNGSVLARKVDIDH